MISAGVFVGKIFDDYGPAILLAVGTFMHVFGLMMMSISKTYYQILLSQAVCSGIGASMVFFPAFTCVSYPVNPGDDRITSKLLANVYYTRFRHGSCKKEVLQLGSW